MKIFQKKTIFTLIAALILGVGLHFLFSWLPSPITALVSPVRESLWEHLKIIVWPYLAAAFLLTRNRPTGLRPWLLSLLVMCAAMLALGYWYHILLGGEAFFFDLGLYLLVMAFGFWFPRRFSGPFDGLRWKLPILGTAALFVLLILFTLSPPEGLLFADLSGADTWSQLPC